MTTSLLPRDIARPVAPGIIASHLGRHISEDRHGRTIGTSIRGFLRRHGISPGEEDIGALVSDIEQSIMADRVLDSEEDQAVRACTPAVREHLTDSAGLVQSTGWFPGEVVVSGEPFELTGDACTRCEVNPQAYGVGGGTRCISSECGAWDCA